MGGGPTFRSGLSFTRVQYMSSILFSGVYPPMQMLFGMQFLLGHLEVRISLGAYPGVGALHSCSPECLPETLW